MDIYGIQSCRPERRQRPVESGADRTAPATTVIVINSSIPPLRSSLRCPTDKGAEPEFQTLLVSWASENFASCSAGIAYSFSDTGQDYPLPSQDSEEFVFLGKRRQYFLYPLGHPSTPGKCP
jgi:hypothetical protein